MVNPPVGKHPMFAEIMRSLRQAGDLYLFAPEDLEGFGERAVAFVDNVQDARSGSSVVGEQISPGEYDSLVKDYSRILGGRIGQSFAKVALGSMEAHLLEAISSGKTYPQYVDSLSGR